MDMLVIGFMWLLNLAISAWNAYACGTVWAETKAAGGWPRFMTWMGAIMSASGFTWCYLIVLALGAHSFDWLSEYQLKICLELGYLIIIPGILFSGLMIIIDSWATAYRHGGVLNYGVAAYNTYAQVHNTLSAIGSMGEAFSDVLGAFKGGGDDDDNDGAALLIIIALVVIAVAGGVLTTVCIIKKVAASQPLLSQQEMQDKLDAKTEAKHA